LCLFIQHPERLLGIDLRQTDPLMGSQSGNRSVANDIVAGEIRIDRHA
jgi:hypothetical protein